MCAITRHPAPFLINVVITKEYFSSCSNNLQTRSTLLLLLFYVLPFIVTAVCAFIFPAVSLCVMHYLQQLAAVDFLLAAVHTDFLTFSIFR